jgi:hypothetical protein
MVYPLGLIKDSTVSDAILPFFGDFNLVDRRLFVGEPFLKWRFAFAKLNNITRQGRVVKYLKLSLFFPRLAIPHDQGSLTSIALLNLDPFL